DRPGDHDEAQPWKDQKSRSYEQAEQPPEPRPGLRPGLGAVAAADEPVRLLCLLKVAAHDREIADREPRLVEQPHRALGRSVVGISRHDAGNNPSLRLAHNGFLS